MKMNPGIWIGIVGGLIGFGVAIVSVLMTTGREGIYITAGILLLATGMGLLFYKLIFAPMILARRLQKVGIPGKATIKEMHDTGVTVNNNPQVKLLLEVKSSLGHKYNTSIRTLVSRLQTQVYQPGSTIPVLIDPENEHKLVIDFNSSPQTGPGANFRRSDQNALKDELMKDQQEGDAIRLTGRPARAIVKKYTWLGVNINGNNPYAQLEVEVLPDDAPAFSATVKAAIKEESVPKYQPGGEIFVKYNAYDLTRVVIDHS